MWADSGHQDQELEDAVIDTSSGSGLVKNVLIKVGCGLRNAERSTLQTLALTILGQLTRQGLVNPIAITEPLFTLLFNPKVMMQPYKL